MTEDGKRLFFLSFQLARYERRRGEDDVKALRKKEERLTPEKLFHVAETVIEGRDVSQAKREVGPFVKDPETLMTSNQSQMTNNQCLFFGIDDPACERCGFSYNLDALRERIAGLKSVCRRFNSTPGTTEINDLRPSQNSKTFDFACELRFMIHPTN